MTIQRKPLEPERWTRRDEENLLVEIAEDRRLRHLGIDPDSDSIDIMLQLEAVCATYRHTNLSQTRKKRTR